MSRINTIQELIDLKNETNESMQKYKYIIQICGGAGCVSASCQTVKDALINELEAKGLQDRVLVNVT